MIKNGANQKKLKKGIVSLRELQHDSHRSSRKFIKLRIRQTFN